jgi:molecular chaperone GrpE
MSEQLKTEHDAPATGESAAEAQPSADPSGASDANDSPDALRRERDALQDRLLRTLAEFAAADVLTDLLPIVDNLERALQAPAAGDDAFRKGVELIHKQMLDLLRKRGVRPIEAHGQPFDPNFHQAVVHEASDEHAEGEVMQELQRGYLLGERLLRPAMVKVAKRS